jgi:hypothetical protein
MKNAASRPGHVSCLDATCRRPYSRGHDQRRDHLYHSPPPHPRGTGDFARLKSTLPPDPIRGIFLKSSAI